MFISIIIFTTTIILIPLLLVGCIMLTNVAVDASDKYLRRVNNNENL